MSGWVTTGGSRADWLILLLPVALFLYLVMNPEKGQQLSIGLKGLCANRAD
jgi:hypothetical protein